MTFNRDILATLDTTAPVPDELLQQAQNQYSGALPSDYVEFLRLTNGAEGDLGNLYVQLWSLERMLESTTDYSVDEFAPGLLLFGSDGGGEAFGFDCRTTPWKIVQIPFIPLDWKEAITVGDSFITFLQWASSAS